MNLTTVNGNYGEKTQRCSAIKAPCSRIGAMGQCRQVWPKTENHSFCIRTENNEINVKKFTLICYNSEMLVKVLLDKLTFAIKMSRSFLDTCSNIHKAIMISIVL